MPGRGTKKRPKQVESLTHDEARRRNIPTAELQPTAERQEESHPFAPVAYKRARRLESGEKRVRDENLDPQIVWRGASVRLTRHQIAALKNGKAVELGDAQLVWRGKDTQDWSDLVVQAPPIYVQEKIHPRAIIEDLRRQTRDRHDVADDAPDLFGDFNGLEPEAMTEFYQHDQHWQNRMILGDSLHVMASLAERESLRGKVQCIYFDPPYGIRFNSNWQVSTRSRDVKDGKMEHISREPEQVKAFRDTWRDGIHSYLAYLRDRLTAMRDLLTESGSIFVQIGDENVHRVRAVMDEVFGEENFVSLITCRVSSGTTRERSVKSISDYLLWYGKCAGKMKFRRQLQKRIIETRTYNQVEEEDGSRRPMTAEERKDTSLLPNKSRAFQKLPLHSMNAGDHEARMCFGSMWRIPPTSHWRYSPHGFQRLLYAGRVSPDKTALRSICYHDDYPAFEINNLWDDTGPEIVKSYVVQTATKIIQRCLLMTTDPGDLVLDPTCGSGTTATVPNNGGGAGSPSTHRASPWPWREPGSWARATPITTSPTARKANGKKRKSSAFHRPDDRPETTSARALSMNGCRTSPSSRLPTTPKSM